MRGAYPIAVYIAIVLAIIVIGTLTTSANSPTSMRRISVSATSSLPGGQGSSSASTSLSVSTTVNPVTIPQSSALSVTCALNSNAGSNIGACAVDSLSLSMLALLLSFAFVGLAFMLGEAFGLESLKGWYKNELKESVKTLAIIVFLFTVLVILGSIAVALAGYPLSQAEASGTLTGSASAAGGEVANSIALLYYTANTSYLSPQLTSAYTSLSTLVGVSMGVGFLKGVTIFMWTPFPVPPLPPFLSWVQTGFSARVFASRLLDRPLGASPGISLLGDVLGYVTLPVVTILQVQSDFFGAFMGVALLVLLPIGILLRAVPLVRGIGGTLIALAVGIALVYPMLLVSLNLPISNYVESTLSSSSSSYVYTLPCSGLIGSLTCFAASVGSGLNSGTLQLVAGSNGNGAAETSGVNIGLNSMNSIYPSINLITTEVLKQILQLILFIFDLIIVVASVNAIASLLGGKLRTGIGRFRLA